MPPADRTPDVVERDELLTLVARRPLADLGASAVNVYLHDADSRMLSAAVVAVTPLGIGSVERVPEDEYVYASATAFSTGKITTAHSLQELGSHPELAVFAPFPFTVTSVPLISETRRFGAVAAYWPQMFRVLTDDDRRYLHDLGAETVRKLERLVDRGVSMEPPRVPLVVTAPGEAANDAHFDERSWATTPLIYHVHKLANALIGAERTSEAANLALERITNGFNAPAMALSLIDGDRLRVIGASGCSRSFLRRLHGRPLGVSSPETDAMSQKRQIVQGPPEEGGPEPGVPERDNLVWAVLPLLAGGHAIGSCSIGFRPDQASILSEHSILIALATLLGQTFERTWHRDAQHALAQRLQQTLLPRMLPHQAGVITTTRYVPTSSGIELGGDWYDVINLPDGGIGAVIGDVQGHNIAAAITMGQLRSAVRAYAAEGHDPSTVLSRTNRLLLELETDRFATCCCVWLDPSTGTAEIVTAGHHPPLIRSPDGGYRAQEVDPGIPMGIEADARYQATTVTLAPGTLIMLYTGDLAEPVGQPTGRFIDTLEAALADSGGELETLGDRLIGGIASRPARADDAALLLVRYEGPSAGSHLHVRSLAIHRRDLQGVRRARRFLREWLHSVELTPMSEEAELLASEVVTNALIHGDSDVDMHVRRYPERIRVEVRDSDPHPALPVSLGLAEDEAEGGRGLVIVSAMASAWGNSPSGRGKTVWFELPTPGGNGNRDY
ncbi:SpoIIE family protein phosphatase [Streptomyces sp. ME19-01-6]|uniref:SpoIIE family protein phosphatase n=1 Tax=Streptomyces sp. ME19-01-6 TaxID=3028686 RepID=UPI0029A098BB|nr:SpoIIE family protein phosphatase [Streptomyces sp. ME19-01-6]MDX3226293.1 SpoIIE family protein phosphatase [Streptomyces sp. ME19-01-6]